MKTIVSTLLIGMFIPMSYAQDKNGTFSVTDGIKCTRIPSIKNKVSVKTKGKYRVITANAIPNHKVGQFPNPGNPNRMSEQKKNIEFLCLLKKKENSLLFRPTDLAKDFRPMSLVLP